MTVEDFEFRHAIGEDAEAISLVIQRANAARDGLALPIALTDSETRRDLGDRMVKPGSWAFVATAGSKIVGFALGYPSSEAAHLLPDPDTEYLSLLMVDPDLWGQKVASRLIDMAVTQTSEKDRHQLILWTRYEENERARTFYEHKGFELTGETRVSEKRGLQVQYLMNL